MNKKFFQKNYSCKIHVIQIFTAIFLLTSLFSLDCRGQNTIIASFNKKKVFLEIADTYEKKIKGLMGRENLDENAGMIFLFNPAQKVGFWMKNMKIPLDMVFIKDQKIVKMYNNVPVCTNVPCPIYPSENEVDTVIELKAGFCQKYHLKTGQKVKVEKSVKKMQ